MIKNRLEKLGNVILKTVCSSNNEIIETDEAFSLFKHFIENTRGNVYVIGNGGSAGIASHFCNDLIKALKIASNTLVDSNVLTCLANDYGYENCFSEALKVNMKRDDLLVAISSSGNSKNIINAVNVAKNKKVNVISLSGFLQNNLLRSLGTLNFWLDACDYGLVEMGHFFLLHTLVDCYKEIQKKSLNELFVNVQ
ncbi:MAG: hypothetical protein A2888_00015 [Chlamydiae bacterium RIFCSPLOWO2_01_FULL_28_7]|nr:MAG: hypothetical protein A2888_00015 [Chlamydiae bacterium RIFCSPLOWO2_01_FULL_28_7]